MTHVCENITFPQLPLRAVIRNLKREKTTDFLKYLGSTSRSILNPLVPNLCHLCGAFQLCNSRHRPFFQIPLCSVTNPVLKLELELN